MKNRLLILFVTIFSIITSFFVGYYFGNALNTSGIEKIKKSLQVSVRTHGNIIDIEKSIPDIKVIINGEILSGTGGIEIKK